MLGSMYLGSGYPSVIGNVSSLAGQNGSFVQGMQYGYLYQQEPDNYIDEIAASDGTLLFFSQDSQGRAVSYSGPAGTYRAVNSTFIFGA